MADDKMEITQEAMRAAASAMDQLRGYEAGISFARMNRVLTEDLQRAMTQAAEAAAGRALEAAAGVAEESFWNPVTGFRGPRETAFNIATAIRSLDPSQIAADTGEGR